MAKFSSKAASALEKVLKRRTLVQMTGLIDTLETALRNKQAETANVEHEADRVLDVTRYGDGSEIIDKGPLDVNLTKHLDEDDIPRAISAAKSVYNRVAAEREAWVAAEKAEHEAGHITSHLEFKEHTTHGPGTSSWLLTH